MKQIQLTQKSQALSSIFEHCCGQCSKSKLKGYQNRRTSLCGQTEQQHRVQLANSHRNNQRVSSGRARKASWMKSTLVIGYFCNRPMRTPDSFLHSSDSLGKMTGPLCQWRWGVNNLSLCWDYTDRLDVFTKGQHFTCDSSVFCHPGKQTKISDIAPYITQLTPTVPGVEIGCWMSLFVCWL